MNEKDLKRFSSKHGITSTDCWYWLGSGKQGGYGRFGLNGVNRLAHVVSYEHYKGPTNGLNVLHKCDNKRCVNPEHLFLGDQTVNMRDSVLKKRNNVCKLLPEQIPAIKERLKQGHTLKQIATDFDVHFNTISRIKLGKAWSYVN